MSVIVIMPLLSNNTKTNHKTRLLELCSLADEVVIASPFCYTDFEGFAKDLVSCGGVHQVTFITTLKKDEVVGKIDSLLSFRDSMNGVGIEWKLCVDDSLHGKVYIFLKNGQSFSGVITSANLTYNGMEKNHEWGCLIEDAEELKALKQQLLADVEYQLSTELLDDIKQRVSEKYPNGIKKVSLDVVDIEDIVLGSKIDKSARIFIKPIGVSGKPIFEGDFSTETDSYFSKRRPSAVRIGDILITYGVGSCKIIGAYKVTSDPLNTNKPEDRWPWYVKSECMTPNLSNRKWETANLHVTAEAKRYVDQFKKPITQRKGYNLNALNRGCDKICLDNEYGRFLFGKVMALEKLLK